MRRNEQDKASLLDGSSRRATSRAAISFLSDGSHAPPVNSGSNTDLRIRSFNHTSA